MNNFYLPVFNTTSYQIPIIKINQPAPTSDQKCSGPTCYKNPFDYSSIEANVKRSIANNKLKLIEDSVKNDVDVWTCLLCDQEYQSKSELVHHYEQHKTLGDKLDENKINVKKNLKCPVCEETFKSKGSYQLHVVEKHMPKDYFCDICKKNYSNDHNLSVHMARHTENPELLVCFVCKEFSTERSSDLGNHINLKHVTNTFTCEECGQSFTKESWFDEHKTFHVKDQKYFCHVCNVFKKGDKYFRSHMKKVHKTDVALEISNFKCFQCGSTFPRERNLKVHVRYIHTEASCLCNFCGRTFPTQRHLTHHMQTHREPEFVCNFCGKKFKQGRTLSIHMRIHTGDKRNKCKVCNKSFTQKTTLNVHMRIHTGERPYPCGKCQKGFITKTVRDTHQKSCKN